MKRNIVEESPEQPVKKPAEVKEESFEKPTELSSNVIKYIEQLRRGKLVNKERDDLLNFANCKGHEIHQKAVKGHTGCVNAIGLGRDETLLASSGDDKDVFVWKINDMLLDENARPSRIMDGKHFSNVFATSFSSSGNRLISTGNDTLILVHDVETGRTITSYNAVHYPMSGAVYSAAFLPDDENVFVICSEDPDVEVYDVRVPREKIQSWFYTPDNYSIDFHPNGRYFALGGKKTLAVVDFRNGRDIYKNNLQPFILGRGSTHTKWSPDGTGLAVVRSCSIPIYLDLIENDVIYLSEENPSTYFTRNTVKACDFIDNNTIATGSESFEIFMWHLDEARAGTEDDLAREIKLYENNNVPKEWNTKITDPYIKLKGHRSIPNGIKYSPKNGTLFSCGVEKTIRTWSLFPFVGSTTNSPLRSNRQLNHSTNPESEDDDVLEHFDRLITMSQRGLTPFDSDSDSDSDSDQIAFDEELDLSDTSISSDNSDMMIAANDDVELIISEQDRMEILQRIAQLRDDTQE